MRIIAILVAAAATPVLAQDTRTQCQQMGYSVVCNSTTTPRPQDRGRADYLGAMGGLGPSYEETKLRQQQIQQNRNALEMQEIQLRAMKRAEDSASGAAVSQSETYHLDAKVISGLNAVLGLCPSLASNPASVPETDRSVVQALCYAYSQGRSSR